MKMMNVIWKIALLLVILLALFYFLDSRVKENEPLESPVKHGTAIPAPNKALPEQTVGQIRPEKGLSTYVGQNVDLITDEYGQPDRIEPSSFGYNWWVYSGEPQMMVGVEEGKVNQLFSADPNLDLSPYSIGQNVEEIFRFTIIDTEVNVQIDENVYTFTLNNQDIMEKILIKYDDLFAQIYVDTDDGNIEGVRFITPKMLVIHQPYDMEFTGDLFHVKVPSSTEQMEVDRAIERQIYELTNIYREHNGLNTLEYDYWLSKLAQEHSKDMAIENYFSHESPSAGNLSERLKRSEIEHKRAGENIATNYVDAIDAVHGWLNSPAHRSVLLDAEMTEIGTGAYGKYFTQVMIKSDSKRKSEPGLLR
ncbi:hypothetical protein H9649_02380 [Sporosarcina sp. Sa2YVA2]|uniref:Uncharacterized protein n=2 Tax=Sporosarcina quadrami TaxID=2762234 RepID=A0ABR8U7C5_9BACL|nr:hypothetical protein [Sporosarcina quadrami]